jgi:hypothetical protein
MGFFDGLLNILPFIAAPFTGGASLGLAPAAAGTDLAVNAIKAAPEIVGKITAKDKANQQQPLTPVQATPPPTLGSFSGFDLNRYAPQLPGGEKPIPGVPMAATGNQTTLSEPATLVGQSGTPLMTMGAGENVNVAPQGQTSLNSMDLLKTFAPLQAAMTGNTVPKQDAPGSTTYSTDNFDFIGMKNMGDVAKVVASLAAAIDNTKRANLGRGPGVLSQFLDSYSSLTKPPAQPETDRAVFIDPATGNTMETVVDKMGNRIGQPWLKNKAESPKDVKSQAQIDQERADYLFKEKNKVFAPTSRTTPETVTVKARVGKGFFGGGKMENVTLKGNDVGAYQFTIDNPTDPNVKAILAKLKNKYNAEF